MPGSVLTANRVWQPGDQAVISSPDGLQRTFIYVGDPQNQITNTLDADWREAGGGLDIYETGDADSPQFDLSSIRFDSADFNISVETYQPVAGDSRTKRRLVLSLSGGTGPTFAINFGTITTDFISNTFGTTLQRPTFTIPFTSMPANLPITGGTITEGGNTVATIPAGFASGGTVQLDTAVTFSAARTYMITLNGDDGSGGTATRTATVTLGPASASAPQFAAPTFLAENFEEPRAEFDAGNIEQFDTGRLTFTLVVPNPNPWRIQSISVMDQDSMEVAPTEAYPSLPATEGFTRMYQYNVALDQLNPRLTYTVVFENPADTSETTTATGDLGRFTTIRSFRAGSLASDSSATQLTLAQLQDLTTTIWSPIAVGNTMLESGITFGTVTPPASTVTLDLNENGNIYFVQDAAQTPLTSIAQGQFNIIDTFTIFYVNADGMVTDDQQSDSLYRVYNSGRIIATQGLQYDIS